MAPTGNIDVFYDIVTSKDTLYWLLNLDSKLYGNAVDLTGETGKVSRTALRLLLQDIQSTLKRYDLLEEEE